MCERENYNIHAHYLRYLKNRFESPRWLTIHHLGRWPFSGRKLSWPITSASSRVVSLSSDNRQTPLVFWCSHTLILWESNSQKAKLSSSLWMILAITWKYKNIAQDQKQNKNWERKIEIKAWALSDLFWANGLRSKSLFSYLLQSFVSELQRWLPNIKTQASSLFLLFYSAHPRNPKPKTVLFFFSLEEGPSTKQKALALYLLGSTCELSL